MNQLINYALIRADLIQLEDESELEFGDISGLLRNQIGRHTIQANRKAKKRVESRIKHKKVKKEYSYERR